MRRVVLTLGWVLWSGLGSMPSLARAEEPAAVPAPARVHPQPWHDQATIPTTGGDIHMAVYALRLAGLSEENGAQLARDIANRSQSTGGLAVIDATDGRLLIFDVSPQNAIAAERRVAVFSSIRERTRAHAGQQGQDLPASLQTMADITRAVGGRLASLDYYLVGPFRPNAGGVDFADGYPNDGFLLLDDTDFALVAPAPAPGSRLHVLGISEMANRAAYQRFAALLAGQMFRARLASFSSGMVEGDLPPFSLEPPPDASLRRSAILRPAVRPDCPYDDTIKADQVTEARLAVQLTNPCRRNSMVSTTQNGMARNALADGEGVASLSYQLAIGPNEITASSLDGRPQLVFRKTIDPVPDSVDVGQTDEKVSFDGHNPFRLDDSEVVLREPATGRVWSTHVHDGRWRIDTPLSPGRHSFYLERPGGGVPQRIYVNRRGGGADFDRATDKGGRTGVVQALLAWDDVNDLDLAIECPDKIRIFYGRREHCGGALDVDTNRAAPLVTNAAENIYWNERPTPGTYKIYVIFYKRNGAANSAYRLRVLIDDRVINLAGVADAQRSGSKSNPVYTFEIK